MQDKKFEEEGSEKVKGLRSASMENSELGKWKVEAVAIDEKAIQSIEFSITE